MIASGKRDIRQAWLGGEAHVRRQEAGRLWRVPPRWRQGLWLSGALLLGSALGGGGVAAACLTRRLAAAPEPKKEVRMRIHRPRRATSVTPLIIALAAGAAVGAGVAFFTAPHPGPELRRRIANGARIAQEELSEVVEETRGAVGALTKDARQTLRQTALRLSDVVTAMKDAFQADAGRPERAPVDE